MKRIGQKTSYSQNTLLTREAIKSFYMNKYFNLYMNLYKINGVDYQQRDYFLRKMWEMGTVAISVPTFITSELLSENTQVIFTPYACSSFNINDWPVKVSLINVRGAKFIPTKLMTVDEDVVIGYAQRNKKSVRYMVEFYVEQIVDLELTKRTSLKSIKTPWVIGVSPEDSQKKYDIKNQIDGDNPYIFVELNNSLATKALVSGAPYIVDKITNEIHDTENKIREYLGIDNLGVSEKKEHLVVDEINMNEQQTQTSESCFLDSMTEMFSQANKVLGVNLSIETNKPNPIKEPEQENEEDNEDESI